MVDLSRRGWLQLLAVILLASSIEPVPAGGESLAWVQIVGLVVSLALMYLASQKLNKDDDVIDKDKPATLTTRGSYIPWNIGIRRVGPVFSGAWDRIIKKEELEGSKDLGLTPEQDVFYEGGWHQIGSNGPVYALHGIYERGKLIFQGPITSDSHPSGSVISLGKEGSFVIYWGEETQPINTRMGATNRVGITSRWPFLCYVEWIEKRLGPSPNWPELQYVTETRPKNTVLSDTDAWIDGTLTLDGSTISIDSTTTGIEDVGYFEVIGDAGAEFSATKFVRLTGNALADQDFEIKKVVWVQTQTGTAANGAPIFRTDSRLFPVDGVPGGADDAGTLQAYSETLDDGVNPAHAIAEALFAPWPQGAGLDPDSTLEPWDQQSLEDLGTEADTDKLACSFAASQGKIVGDVVGGALQDLGTMLAIDTSNGKLSFRRLRSTVIGSLSTISEDMQGEVPEQVNELGARATDRPIYSFPDRESAFGEKTLKVTEDGHASLEEVANAQVVQLSSTVNFLSAVPMAERRSQEMLGGSASIPIKTGREARELLPGDPILAEGLDEVLRITEVKLLQNSGVVELVCIPDAYGVEPSGYENGQGGGQPDESETQPDPQSVWAEIPEYLMATPGVTAISIPRIRDSAQIIGSSIHLSGDDVTYTLKGSQNAVATGGTLDAQLDASEATLQAQGPEFTVQGPDIGAALDLSSSAALWRQGRQLCLIASTAGQELCFVQAVTAVGGDTWRLDGLIRARYDSQRLTHPAGAAVFIFADTTLPQFQDILLDTPGDTLYFKSQPSSSGGQVPFEAIAPYANLVEGKNVVPMAPLNLRVSGQSNAYETGDDVTLKWSYRSTLSPKTGAGMQGAGAATGVSAVDGTFLLTIETVGGTEVRAVSQTSTTYTYDNADLQADLGGEPNFVVKVKCVRGGISSTILEITVESI